jgi:hypothetical protein
MKKILKSLLCGIFFAIIFKNITPASADIISDGGTYVGIRCYSITFYDANSQKIVIDGIKEKVALYRLGNRIEGRGYTKDLADHKNIVNTVSNLMYVEGPPPLHKLQERYIRTSYGPLGDTAAVMRNVNIDDPDSLWDMPNADMPANYIARTILRAEPETGKLIGDVVPEVAWVGSEGVAVNSPFSPWEQGVIMEMDCAYW